MQEEILDRVYEFENSETFEALYGTSDFEDVLWRTFPEMVAFENFDDFIYNLSYIEVLEAHGGHFGRAHPSDIDEEIENIRDVISDRYFVSDNDYEGKNLIFASN